MAAFENTTTGLTIRSDYALLTLFDISTMAGGDLQPTAKINLTAHSGGPYFTNPTTPFDRSTSEWEEDAFLRGKRESAQNNRVVNKDGYVPPPITRKKDAATSPEPNLSTLHDVKYSPSTMARPDG